MVASSDEAPDDLLDDAFLMGARGMEAALEHHLRDQVGEGNINPFRQPRV
jgi:hypothetical protein